MLSKTQQKYSHKLTSTNINANISKTYIIVVFERLLFEKLPSNDQAKKGTSLPQNV